MLSKHVVVKRNAQMKYFHEPPLSGLSPLSDALECVLYLKMVNQQFAALCKTHFLIQEALPLREELKVIHLNLENTALVLVETPIKEAFERVDLEMEREYHKSGLWELMAMKTW